MIDESMQLEEQAKTASREYQRQWRKRNPERIKTIDVRYWQRRAQKFQGNKRRDVNAKTDQ